MDPAFVTAFNANGASADGRIVSTGGKIYSVASRFSTEASWGNASGNGNNSFFTRVLQFNFIRLA